jgi:hypothetical protein
MKGWTKMPKTIKRKLNNGVVVELYEVPHEETPEYWLEKHRDILEQREEARQREAKAAWESCKDIVIGGPGDKTNRY